MTDGSVLSVRSLQVVFKTHSLHLHPIIVCGYNLSVGERETETQMCEKEKGQATEGWGGRVQSGMSLPGLHEDLSSDPELLPKGLAL